MIEHYRTSNSQTGNETHQRSNIVLLTTELPGYTSYTGGIGPFFDSLARALSKRGHRVQVLVQTEEADRHSPSVPYEVIVVAPLPRRLPHFLRAVEVSVAFRRQYQQLDGANVILAPEWGGWASTLTSRHRRKLVTNLVTALEVVRSIEPLKYSARSVISDTVQSWLEKRQVRRSRKVIAISQVLLDKTQNVWRRKIATAAVVHNFTSVCELQRNYAHEPRAGTLRDPQIVFVGRVCKWKGADLLAEAMNLVHRELPGAAVRFIGRIDEIDGTPAGEWIDSVVDLSGQVFLDGPIPQDAVFEAIRSADMAVFPSRFEGFGMAALEAMAIGVPVVVTDGTGYDAFATNNLNALKVDAGKADSLARAILRLSGDEGLRRQLSQNAVIGAQRFDSENVISGYEAELLDLVGIAK